jgi:maltooligosyltrehalose trehalohydrolase
VNIPLFKIGARYDLASSEFIVWAPFRTSVELMLDAAGPAGTIRTDGEPSRLFPLEKDESGYWKLQLPDWAPPGSRYLYRLDRHVVCPDPASFSQPQGVHGASELTDLTQFRWTDASWNGIAPEDMIIYEIHTGTFSPTHDFKGIIEKLEYLAGLGINTIELMPLGQFPGDRNWGYDGVYPFAVQHSYGGVQGLQSLIDAAHAQGIAVLIDVVYNHLGPEGNYLGEYGPYFTDKYKTPWGKALNFDDAWADGVRNFFFENARMWLEDFHADGLRLDAVHAIKDFSAVHFIRQLKDLASDIQSRTGYKRTLIAEMDLNDPRYINPPEKGGYGLDGQWIDEFHHSLRSLLTGDKAAYYEDFGQIGHLEKAYRDTYVYDGIYSSHRKRFFGGRANDNHYGQFVVFAQNHDQVGNRAMGERLTDHLSFEQLKLAAATVLLSPYIPLLFMGEEYGEKNPFAFFVDFSDPDLVKAVRDGRRAEFHGFADHHVLPDPQSEDTFQRSVLSWECGTAAGSTLLNYYRQLIALRKKYPALRATARETMVVRPANGNILPFERSCKKDQLFIWLHFGGEKTAVENATGLTLSKIWDSADEMWGGPGGPAGMEIADRSRFELAPWSVVVYEKKYT